MVAAVSSSGLGLFGSSLNVLGGGGAQGNPTLGRGTDRVYVNAATGNLIIQSQDERLSSLGLGLSLVRTYNSQGLLNDDNGDNWILGVHQRVYGLTGTVNTANSTVRKVFGDGRDVLFTYNTTRARYESTEGDGAHDTLSFDTGTSQWTWTDGSSRNKETYNNSGQLLNSRDADGNTVTFGYTGTLLTSITDASSQVTSLVYSGNNLTEVRVVSNSVTQTLTRYTYDGSNRLSTVTVDLSPGDNSIADGRVYTSTYTYDGTSRRVASITQSDGSAVSFTYQNVNGQYRVATYTVSNAGGNRTTTFTYTNYNSGGAVYLQTDVQDPLGLVTSYTHDTLGRLTAVLSPTVGTARLQTSYGYDSDGNLTSITEDPTGLNRQTVMTYDVHGNLLTTRDSLGNSTARTYSASNQLLTETVYVARDPDGAGSGTPGTPLTTRYAYDAEDHLRFVITPNGRTTEHRYNAAGQRTATLRYTGGLYTAANFAESDLTTWAAAQNQTALERVDYAYDFRGNIGSTTTWSETTSAGAGSGTPSITRFVYDQRGQLLQTIEARGEATAADPNDYRTVLTYDGLGRQLTKTEWVSATVARGTSITYDDANRQTVTTLANGLTSTSVYNQAGELIRVINGAGGTLGTTTFKYDANGRLRMTTDPTGVRQFSFYDEAGRKVATVDGDGSLVELVYNRAGQIIKTIEYAAWITNTALVDGSDNPIDVALSTLRSAAGGDPDHDRISRSVFDESGALVYTIDASGAVTEYRYDGVGRLTDTIEYYNPFTVLRSVGEVLPDDVTVTAPSNSRRTRSFYDEDSHLIGKLDSDGYLTEYVYGQSGRLTSQVRYANQTDAGIRDTGTFAVLKGDAGTDETVTPEDPERDILTRFLYDGQGRQVGVYDAEGYLTETVYDVAGNIAERIRYDQALTWSATATVATLRNQVQSTKVRERTVYGYDGAGQVITETFSRGTATATSSVTTTYTYDGVGNLLSTTRAASTASARTVETRYDFLGRVTQELTAEGRALITGSMTQTQIDDIWNRYGVTYTYDTAGRRVSGTVRPNDSQTNTTLYYYDNDGRLRFEINAQGERVEYQYNALGQLRDEIRYTNRISTTGLTGGLLTQELSTTLSGNTDSAKDARTTYTYSLTGRVASVRVAKNTNNAEDGLTTYTYNAFGENDVKIESIDGSRTLRYEYTYDKRGLLTETRWDHTTGGFNIGESRTYDPFGRLRTVTDARNNVVRRYEYDRLGREIASTNAGISDRTVTEYDAFSRVLKVWDAQNNLTAYTYDDANRRMTITTPEGVAIVTTYSVHNQELTVVAAGNTATYTYDANGQLTSISDSLSAADGRPLETRTYDRRGRQITTTDARGIVTTFAYDAANRVLTRTEDSGAGGLALVTTYTYDGQGRVTRVLEPSGRITDTTYDRDGRVTQIAVDPNGANIRTSYAYDRQDHVILVTEGVGDINTPPRRTQYIFDTLGRRIEEIIDPTSLGGTLNLRTEYRYDANGNLTRRIDANLHSTWYVYDTDNRLTNTIDALGGVTSFTYDREDRVIGERRHLNTVTTGSFGDIVTSVTVGINPGDRFTQRVYDRDGREKYTIDALGGVTERVFDDNGNVTRERRYAIAIAAGTYTSATDVAAALTNVTNALTSAGNNTTTLAANDRVTWMAYDLRGRLAFAVDGLGAVVQNVYDANGNVTARTAFATPRSTSLATDLATLQSWATSNAGNAQNRTTRSWYDGADRLRFTLDPEGYLTETRYNDAGRTSTQFAYAGKPTIAAGATLTQVVTAAGAAVDTAKDQSTITLYDAAGRISRVTDAFGNYDEYTYDAVGNRLTYRNKRGSVWNYEYDANGRLKKEIAPSVALTTVSESGDTLTAPAATNVRIETVMEYDGLGNVKTRTEAANIPSQARTTTYRYDALGRQTHVYFPSVGVYATSDDADLGAGGAVVTRTETTPELYTETTYDALGNAFRNRDVANGYSYKVYDQLGRVKYEVDAMRYVTSYTYDVFGNQETITRHNNQLTGVLSTTSASISASDVTNWLTPSSFNRTITMTYNRLGNVTQVTQPPVYNYLTSGYAPLTAGATVVTEYNAFGQAVRMRQLVAASTYADSYFYYDRRGLKTAQIDPAGTPSSPVYYLTQFEYDETGDLTRQVEYSRPVTGTVSTSSYGNVVVTTAAGNSGNAAGYDRDVRWLYDRLNRMVSETRIGVEHTTISGSTTTTTILDQATTYGYDAVGNRTRVTVGVAETFTYYDVLGRVVAIAEPTRNRGNGGELTPLTLMRRDAHGNLVEQRILAGGAIEAYEATAANAMNYTPSSLTNADRLTLMHVDKQGRVLQTYEWLNGSDATSRYASYNERGEVEKEWQRVTNGSVAETIVTLYEYDALGRRKSVSETQRFNGSTPVLATTRSEYNAFGEIISKSVDGLAGTETFEYDIAGRLWRTNSGDGVYKVYLFDLLGNATAEIKAQHNGNGSTDLSTPLTAEAAKDLSGTIRTETVYDVRGQIIEQRAPTVTVQNPQEQITRTVAVHTYAGNAYLHFLPPLDATLTIKIYINGVERTLIDVPTGEEFGYEKGVNLTALGLGSGTYTYQITYSRPGDSVPIAAVNGTFAYSVTTTSTIGITSTAGAGAVSDVSAFLWDAWTIVSWAGNSSGITSATLQVLVNGTWQSYAADVNEGGWVASFGALGAGSYSYRITNYVNGVIHSVGRGTLSVTGATTSTSATGITPSAPWAAVAPISASATAVAQAGGTRASSSTAISEPMYDESGNFIGYFNYWSGTNVANLSWLDVGHQPINVVLYYRTNTGLDTSISQQFAAGAYTGGQISWTNTTQPDGSHGHGGFSQINAVVVYDANWNLLRHSSYTSSNTRLTWTAPPQPNAGGWVYYKPAGAANWTGFGVPVRSGSSFIVDLPALSNGTYDYHVIQWPDFSNESSGTESTASGQFVVSGNTAYIASQSGTPSYLSGVSASGDRLYWNYTPANGDSITVQLNSGAYNLTPVHYGSGNYYASFFGVPSGTYSYTIRYNRGGSTYLLGTGSVSISTTQNPPTISASAPSNIGSIGGFTDLGGGYYGWTTGPDQGGTLAFKYKPAGAANWSQTLTPALSGGYYRVFLGNLSGSYDYEVTYVGSDGGAYRVGSGRVGISSNTTYSGTVTPSALPTMNTTPTQRQTFDRWGNVLTATTVIQELQPNGTVQTQNNTWTYRYNQNGQVIQITEPVTAVLKVDRNTGAVSTSNEAAVSYNYYDLFGRLIGTRDGNGNLNSKSYNEVGQTIAERFADGGQKIYIYDVFGQQIQITDQAGYRTRQQFDRAGRLTATATEIVSGVFDTIGLWDVTQMPGFVAANNGVLLKQYTYDQASRRLSETTGEVMDDGITPETRRYTYDLMGNVIGYGGTLGASIQFRYDALGRKVFHQNGLGAQATWTYDYFGHVTGHVDFGGTSYTYNYDVNRTWLLRSQTSSGGANGGQNKAYHYDAVNQLTRLVDTGVGVNRTTQYIYDGAGRISHTRTLIGEMLHEDTRTRYDAVGRILQVSGRGFIVTYSYDLADNRTRINASYASSGYTLNTQDLWYRYDVMNRVTVSQGINDSGTVKATTTTGTELTYDARGMRASAATAENLHTYTYDGLGRLDQTTLRTLMWDESSQPIFGSPELVEDRDYDRASRVTRLETRGLEGGSWTTHVTTTTYSDAGLTLHQLTQKKITTGPFRNESEVSYGAESGYDAAGNVLAYTTTAYKADGTLHYTSSHTYTYRLAEGYQESTHSVTSSGVVQNGSTSHTYNANGELIQFTDTRDQTLNRYFANNANGNPLTVVKGNYGTDPSGAFSIAVGGSGFFNTANAGYFFFSADGQQIGTFGQLDGTGLKANFDVNYTPVSSSYPSTVPSSYVAQQGDTLRSIAAKLFGDGNLWYLIAQANGLSDPDAVIPDGRTLEIPNQVVSLSNNASVFKPFDINDAIGDTTPTQPAVPAPKKKGCGVIGMILIVVVAIVVTVFTAGVATGATTGIWSAGMGALGGSSITAAAIGGAVGAAASQGVAIAMGVQEGFDWKGVALGAIGAGVGAAMGGSSVLKAVSDTNKYLGAAVNAAAGNAITQGVAVATGLQKSFDWKSVAMSAVAAPIAKYLGEQAGGLVGGAKYDPESLYPSLGKFTNDVVGSVTTAGVRTAFGGKFDEKQVAADAFGTAIGNSIVGFAIFSNDISSLSQRELAVYNDALKSGGSAQQAMNVARAAGKLYSDPKYFREGGGRDSRIEQGLLLNEQVSLAERTGHTLPQELRERTAAYIAGFAQPQSYSANAPTVMLASLDQNVSAYIEGQARAGAFTAGIIGGALLTVGESVLGLASLAKDAVLADLYLRSGGLININNTGAEAIDNFRAMGAAIVDMARDPVGAIGDHFGQMWTNVSSTFSQAQRSGELGDWFNAGIEVGKAAVEIIGLATGAVGAARGAAAVVGYVRRAAAAGRAARAAAATEAAVATEAGSGVQHTASRTTAAARAQAAGRLEEFNVEPFDPWNKHGGAERMAKMTPDERKAYMDEYEAQLSRQEAAINDMTANEFKAARDAYKATGRHPEADKLQKDAGRDFEKRVANDIREEIANDPANAGLSKRQINRMVKERAAEIKKNYAALHEPDMAAGGAKKPAPTQMGNASVNSAIGGSWPSRLPAIDQMVENVIRMGMGNSYMNLRLIVNKGPG